MAAEYTVALDEKGRLLLPAEARRRLGLKPRSRVIVRVREDGVAELYPLEALERRVRETARRKLRGWREELHEATRLLEETLGAGEA